MGTRDTQPEDKTAAIHDFDNERLLEAHDQLLQIVTHGDPDSVTPEQLRKKNRIEMELLNRMGHALLEDDGGER